MDVDALVEWYGRVKRPLPWRATRDPYALLVSEVMLQQTQAARVVPYYERFLGAFPDADALAAAEPAEVLREWSGLGYNRRALALQAAARQVADHGWPTDLEELPGVGPYTAAAVASFAWDAPVVAVDTNVRRLVRRHDGTHRTPRALAERARELLPHDRAATFNQATMELGATICRSHRPHCARCPVARSCAWDGTDPVPVAGRPKVRFEDTDRWLRGRLVATRVNGTAAPTGVDPDRLARVIAGLERDGLL